MNRLFDILYSLAEKIITIIFSIIILYLLILAGFSTTNVELHTEHVLLGKDSIGLNLLVLIAFILIAYIATNKAPAIKQLIKDINSQKSYL